ncbi:NOL1/NOP2/sun family protein [Phlyctema vagabunda]|uniref:NOL1/NOP2/sun family protein n=1 Tax=Phlyctema vagabunda TaxID=108571 RepID=A0ABR4PJY7_9HELO
MSLYYEAAEVLTAPANAGGSLKSRIFSKKDLKSQPAQIYALAIETAKWSPILKEIIEFADILKLERKLTPVLSLLLVHDLLLAKRGVALPATHGLRTAIERHKGRLQAELTKARIRRKLSSIEALKAYVETGKENGADMSEAPYPRWIRINTLKSTLEDQLETTFKSFERANSIDLVRERGSKRLYIDANIPDLVAISPNCDLSKSEAYKTGAIIFQDKASCFPAYLLNPLADDGDIIDTCSAPGNKTTHLAALLVSHCVEPDESTQVIHAFEKNKGRAETLEKMVTLAGSDGFTKLHPGYDFLKSDPEFGAYKKVGALLLDPSCSGSGIVGRDDMPELHLPAVKQLVAAATKQKGAKLPDQSKETRKRKREDKDDKAALLDVMVDDDGVVTAVNTDDELKARLEALATFQLELLLHAFKFPSATKITYSTCSIHAAENEHVVRKALRSEIAKQRGWTILTRDRQIQGMKDWPVRGSLEASEGNKSIAEACIRANKGDGNGTMGFFVAAFVRNQDSKANNDVDPAQESLRASPTKEQDVFEDEAEENVEVDIPADDWEGFGEEAENTSDVVAPPAEKKPKYASHSISKHAHKAGMKRPELIGNKKKRGKGKKS